MAHTPQTCYWCGAPSVGDEHFPPENLYAPETKSLPTVPSCYAHNQALSKLDERMRFFIQACAGSDESRILFKGKTWSGLKRSPKGLLSALARASIEATLDGEKTIAVRSLPGDQETYFEKISRAVYFHEFDETFQGEVRSACSHCPEQNADVAAMAEVFSKISNQMRSGATAHPSVFQYQMHRPPGPPATFFLRMQFYTNVSVFAVGAPGE